ncbi:30S ribosomal protein S1 [Salinicoccus halodurans]|uniref:SSU ribosomal protein S1P n=1 Tax=Salinicoccus halodurans TaxID=407035 RepID=A0AA94HD29_9STAP|nr:30S ribosomal protein S1 [Salinicoccus halodurans]SFK60023.1 SSU ribosomal protein S1P [Salinicoccus halodurans]
MTTDNIKNEENQEEVDNSSINENSNEVNEEVSAEDTPQENEVSPGFEVGETVKGTVYKIEDKFVKAHIDDSDFEGIVPISQLTSKRIERPEEIVSEDDSIEGVVIKVENEDDRKNVILSIRKLEESNAYDSLQSAKDNDETITGTVMEVVKAGLVIDVGVRGFIPASLLSDAYIEDLEQFDGQELEVKVEDIEPEKNRVILNRKRIVEAEKAVERKKQLETLDVGSIVEGEVVRITTFGAFINLGEVDGLAHISELSYSRVEKVEDAVNIGDKVNVKILDVDPEQERISLSLKQAQESPFDGFVKEHSEGDVLEGTVRRLVDFGAFVEVTPGVEGLVHVSEIGHEHVAVPSDVLKEGQTVEVKILSLNEDSEKISLSIKETTEPAPRSSNNEPKVYRDDSDDDGPTLGDVFGDRFKDLDI